MSFSKRDKLFFQKTFWEIVDVFYGVDAGYELETLKPMYNYKGVEVYSHCFIDKHKLKELIENGSIKKL